MYNKRNIYLHRFLSFILIFSIIFSMSSFFAVHADEIENDNAGASITYIDEEGNRHDSDKSADYFLAMLENESGVSPYMIPTEDDNSVRITDIVVVKLTEAQVKQNMSTAAGKVAGMTWSLFGGKLLDAVNLTVITKSAWNQGIVSTIVSSAVSSALNHVTINPLSAKLYQYKSWSSYNNCYIVYQCIIYYTNTSMNTVKAVDYWQVRTENNNAVKIQ